MPHLLHSFASEADLVKAVGELSEAFTTDRSRLQKYLSDPRLVSAYAAFYMTTNMPKLEAVMGWLGPSRLTELRKWQLVDVGAGPGTFSLAWKEWGGEIMPIMLESSPVMREQGSRIMRGLYGEEALFKLGDDGAATPRLLLFGHSFNEMGENEAMRLIHEVKPQAVWFIEPGTKEVFRAILEMRERLLKQGWNQLYPCLGAAPCPWKNSGEDWCHQFLEVKHAPDVERLCQLVRKDRRRQPVTVHMFQRHPLEKRTGQLARLIRTHPETKFSLEWEACLPKGEVLEHARLQLMKKDASKGASDLRAGDLVAMEVSKILPDRQRIKILSDS